MANLADQVYEMMRILELVDPQAAARIRGSAVAAQPAVGFPSVMAPSATTSPAPAPVRPPVKYPVSAAPAETAAAPRIIGFTADTLTQGIIWSEILGKPVSRRKRW